MKSVSTIDKNLFWRLTMKWYFFPVLYLILVIFRVIGTISNPYYSLWEGFYEGLFVVPFGFMFIFVYSINPTFFINFFNPIIIIFIFYTMLTLIIWLITYCKSKYENITKVIVILTILITLISYYMGLIGVSLRA